VSLRLQPTSISPVSPVVVAVTGELDIANAAAVAAALRGAEASGATEIVLDLTGLEFIASVGLRILLEADSRARRRGHVLTIRPSPAVRHLTDLTGLTAALPIAA